MRKSWKIIITIVLVLLLLQGVIFAVKQANEPPYESRYMMPPVIPLPRIFPAPSR